MESGIIAVYVSVVCGSLFSQFGRIQESLGEDDGKSALKLLSLLEKSDFTKIGIETDTIPHPSVDQIVELSDISHLDTLVFDPREFDVPVLTGSLLTLRRFHPFLVLSVNPPGFKCEIDTVEHYMRIVEICANEHYSVVAQPDSRTYALRYTP